jgi:PiT family inorganic phosphate transporter
LIGGFAGAAVAHAGFGAINSSVVLKTAAFIFIAPIVGMIIALILSMWFLYSFRQDFLPRLVSLVIIAGIGWFLFTHLETDPAKLKSHYESYFLKVVFFSQNFKWILLSLIVGTMAV